MERDIFKKLEAIKNRRIADPRWIEKTRQLLLSHIKANPIQTITNAPRVTSRTTAWYLGLGYLLRPMARMVPAVLAIILMITGSVSFAARSAIPGDILYHWKLNVNEEFKSALTLGTISQANFEVELVQERLSEIAQISLDPTVTPSAKDRAQIELESQVLKAENVISQLEFENPEAALETTVKFHSVLNANQKILAHLEAVSEIDGKEQLQTTVKTIHDTQLKVENKSSQLTLRNTDAFKAQAKIKTAKSKISAVESVISTTDKSTLNEQAKIQLKNANTRIASARKLYDNGRYSDAYVEAQSSIQFASDAIGLIKAVKNISPEVRDRIAEKPFIKNVAPSIAPIGGSITIEGFGFTSINNIVKIGDGYIVNLESIDTKTINLTIPQEVKPCHPSVSQCPINFMALRPGIYTISVSNDNGISQDLNLTISPGPVQIPQILKISQSSGSVGHEITIHGNNFMLTNRVNFGAGMIGNVESRDGSTISFTIPEKLSGMEDALPVLADTYSISVTNARGTSNGLSFTVVPIKVTPPIEPLPDASPAPTSTPTPTVNVIPSNTPAPTRKPTPTETPVSPIILELDRTSGKTGSTITIIGSGFSPTENTIHFGSVTIANLPSINGAMIQFAIPVESVNSNDVPAGVYTLRVSSRGITSNSREFTVIP